MSPDLNSLPPSLSNSPRSSRPRRISITATDNVFGPPPPRSPSVSLQAAATLNAGLHRSSSNASPARLGGLERRRSSLMQNLSLSDPTVPAPGEMQHSAVSSPRVSTADPHHQRQPSRTSIGELHQELENEQEAQVNHLLQMIRIQQDQIAQIQRSTQHAPESSSTEQHTATALTPTRTNNTDPSSSRSASMSGGLSQVPSHFISPHSLSRQSSGRPSNAGNSRGSSPALRPASGSLGPLTEDFLLGGNRDDSAFYQAETQMLTRENQMLKLRIRELERQISELTTGGQSHGPAQHSPLSATPATSTAEEVPALISDTGDTPTA